MCTTNSSELDERMRLLRDHGMSKSKRYWHEEVGFNYRMTNIQAAIGVAQLERINDLLIQRKSIEDRYKSIVTTGIEWQKDITERKRVIALVSAFVEGNRELLVNKLKNYSIDARPFFYCLSEMPIYRNYARNCVVSKEVSEKGINLPTSNNIDFEKISEIIQNTFATV